MVINPSHIKKGKLNIFEFINFLAAALFLTWYTIPRIMYSYSGGIFNLVVFSVIIIWFITSFILVPKWLLNMPVYLWWLSVFLFWIFFLAAFNIGTDIRAHLKLLLSWWFLVYFSYFYQKYNNKKILYQLMNISILLIFITIITSLYGYTIYPNASKTVMNPNMNGGSQPYHILIKMNIGSIDLINGTLFLIPILFLLAKTSFLKLRHRLFAIIFLILGIILIINSGFAITTLLLIIGLVLCLLPKKRFLNYFTISIFSVPFLFLLKEHLALLLIKIAYFSENELLIRRFNELAMILNGYIPDGSPEARFMDYMTSLKTFFRNPIFGVGGVYYDRLDIIGAHSQWLDDLGRYGIFGSAIFWIFVYNYLKSMYKKFSKSLFISYYTITVILVFLMGCINPISALPTVATSLFFVIPAIGIWYEDKKDFKLNSL